MKLVLFVISVIAIFPADSRDFPGKTNKGDFAGEQDEHFSSSKVISDSMQNIEGVKEINLRGNAGKGILKTMIYKFNAMEQKLIQANSMMKLEIQAIRKHQYNITNINTELKDITAGVAKLDSKLDSVIIAIKGGVLIGGQYLTFSAEKVSWDLANERCKSHNARLAVLANPGAFHTYASSKYRGQYFWLGATDKSVEGTWTWIDGTSLGSFPWGPLQPNNFFNEDCLEWGWGNNYNDETCTDTRRYVCEHGFN